LDDINKYRELSERMWIGQGEKKKKKNWTTKGLLKSGGLKGMGILAIHCSG